MGNMTIELIVLAIVMLLVGVAALYRQSRATTCPKHSREAGRIGVVLAWLSLIAGVCLSGYAVVLYRTSGNGI